MNTSSWQLFQLVMKDTDLLMLFLHAAMIIKNRVDINAPKVVIQIYFGAKYGWRIYLIAFLYFFGARVLYLGDKKEG
ncbi:hypothetical protein [Oceanospirillum linum]|uniref:Uncharacterized protein n=1 Tax=Oceanospirillum linum TaxID=966 RepID=A0A1T1H9I6_OCELI|nr:hypothetical protein [Oceanospirillum linum]OOV86503.1 hypothetical protein BTA35_0213455 [Oceanospirillum linum]